MGMADMFSWFSNFNGISDVPIHVSEVAQKCIIAVNKFGVEAAAATGKIIIFTNILKLCDIAILFDFLKFR